MISPVWSEAETNTITLRGYRGQDQSVVSVSQVFRIQISLPPPLSNTFRQQSLLCGWSSHLELFWLRPHFLWLILATGVLKLWSNNLRLILESVCYLNSTLFREGGIQPWVGVSLAIPPGFIEVEGQEANTKQMTKRQEPPDSSSSPEANAVLLREGASQSPYLGVDLPAGRVSPLLVVLVLLITCSCCPFRDFVYLPFACSWHQHNSAVSHWSKTVQGEDWGDTQ